MGILRPKVQILDEVHKEQIFNEAKQILQTLGVLLENKEAITLFEKEGFNYDGDRYFIPDDVIDKALQNVPKEIKLFDREGKEHINLSQDNVHFDPGSAAILYLDEATGVIREAQSTDFIKH